MLRVHTTLTGFIGGPGLSTQYYECADEDLAAVTRCRQYVHDLWGGCLGSLLSNQVTWTVQAEVDVLTSSNGEIINTIVESSTHTATGGGGVDMAPVASAALVRLNTGTWIAGRHLQGRTFVNPTADAINNSQGAVDGTVIAARNAALVTYLASLDAGDEQVVWHRPVAGAGGATGIITAMTVQEKMAVLTSRRD